MTAPVLDEYAFQYGDDGVLINGDSTVPPFIDLKQVDGLDSAPYKTHSKSYDGRDGGIIAVEFEDIRKIRIAGVLYGGDQSIEAILDTMKMNYAPQATAQPLYFKAAGVDQRVVFCKSMGMRYNWDAVRRLNMTDFEIMFEAEDPTIYGSTLKQTLIYTGSTFGGYSFPRTFSYSFGGSSVPASPPVVNAGTKPVGFEAQFTGQTTVNPRIIHEGLGLTVSLNISIAPTDILTVDFYNEQVYLNGSARRRVVQREGWFKLQPGSNTVTLQSDSAGTSSAVVLYRDGYR